MRNTFIQELVEMARTNPQIALVVGDLGYSVVEPFADEFPDRFINAGVAEQNMTGLAAGMASEGYHVFTYSIANFPTFRCAEQIRNDIDYHNLNVTVVSVGGGLAYGSLGYSHHAVQDYSLIRSFPNMLIASPGDPLEVKACLKYLVNLPGPSYLRLEKNGEPYIHNKDISVEPGRWTPIKIGNGKQALLTTGATLGLAMELSFVPELSAFDVMSLPIWSANCKRAQDIYFEKYETIITLEDHLAAGGFGSWLNESLNESSKRYEVETACIALNQNVCGTVGNQDILNEFGGLSKSKVLNQIKTRFGYLLR